VNGTGNGNSLHLHCGAVKSETEFVLIHLVMHGIGCGLSYYASLMHGIVIYLDFDNDFRGYMIPIMAIPCIGFARL
jgi:hypothetical protein